MFNWAPMVMHINWSIGSVVDKFEDKAKSITGYDIPGSQVISKDTRQAADDFANPLASVTEPVVGKGGSGELPGSQAIPDWVQQAQVDAWGYLGGNEQAADDFLTQWQTSTPLGEKGSLTADTPKEIREKFKADAAKAAAKKEQQDMLDQIEAMYADPGGDMLDREVSAISGEQWNRYIDTYKPFEDKVMEAARNPDKYTPIIQGAINANIMQKQAGMGAFARAAGSRPTIAGSAKATGTAALTQAASRAAVGGTDAIAKESAIKMGNIVEMGRGGADFAVSTLGTAAAIAASQAISDWGYQFGEEKLDTAARMFNEGVSTQQSIQNTNYMSSLFASGAGVAMYGAEQGWFDGGGTNPFVTKKNPLGLTPGQGL